ncbi:MAG: hypothetical protein FD127_3214, partial [Acidimicrobiaceae bacterium]
MEPSTVQTVRQGKVTLELAD